MLLNVYKISQNLIPFHINSSIKTHSLLFLGPLFICREDPGIAESNSLYIIRKDKERCRIGEKGYNWKNKSERKDSQRFSLSTDA